LTGAIELAIEDNRTGMPQDGMRRPRAGFWRRLGAFLCDAALVLIPLQIVVAILFALTNGAIQGNFGFQTTLCSSLDKVPDGLQPALPEGFNSIQDCRLSLFGLVTGRKLVVAKVTETGNSRTAIFRNYSLDANGSPKEGAFDVTWVAILTLLAYMVCMEWRSGETLGKRATGIRVVDVRNPAGTGIPFGRALVRQVATYAGLLPLVALEIGTVIFVSDVARLEALMTSQSYILLLVVAGLFGLAWMIWILVSLARKHDPIYDRLAKTAVVIK
jgi:uncharacterized RDD family membrane protein YckC